MRLILKYKVEIVLGLLIILLFFALRLPNLTLQPIFADEAIYIRWAQVMKAEPTLRFLPLSDGKTPFFMWAMMPLFKVFSDPLLAGRFLSVMSGLVTLAGIYFLGRRVFNSQVGIWAALLYAVAPYTVFFDRMALVDSMLAAFTIWALFFAIWLLKSQRLDLAMILGFLLGGGLLVKTPGIMNIIALPFTIIGFNFKKASQNPLLKLFFLWIVAALIAFLMYNLLRLGPGFEQLSSRNADYVISPVDLLKRPLDPFVPHFKDVADWFFKLLTWPILVVGMIGVIRVIWEKTRLGLVVLLWALLPMLIQMTTLRVFTARYLLFSIPPLLVLAGYGVEQLVSCARGPLLHLRGVLHFEHQRLHLGGVWLLIALLIIVPIPLYFDYLLLTKPENAPLPKAERIGYFEDWTAGYNLKEIAQFLLDEKSKGPVVVGTEGYFGTLPDGLEIYLDKSGIPVIGGNASISAKLRQAAVDNKTFFVANKNRLPEQSKRVSLIKEYPKAQPLTGLRDAIVVYQVFP